MDLSASFRSLVLKQSSPEQIKKISQSILPKKVISSNNKFYFQIFSLCKFLLFLTTKKNERKVDI